MSRQINLLNSALIRQRDYWNAQLLVRVSAGALILMLCIFAYSRYRVEVLIGQSVQLAQQLKDTQLQLGMATQQHAPHSPSKALQIELGRAEDGLKNRQKLLTYLQGGEFGSRQGFSGYMRAFAARSTKGLWLTDFAIDDSVGQISIHGRAVQPELIPQYIAGLGQETLLKGREFSALQINTVDLAPENKAVAVAAPSKSETLKRVVTEFRLQSVEKNLESVDRQSAAQSEKKP